MFRVIQTKKNYYYYIIIILQTYSFNPEINLNLIRIRLERVLLKLRNDDFQKVQNGPGNDRSRSEKKN